MMSNDEVEAVGGGFFIKVEEIPTRVRQKLNRTKNVCLMSRR